MKDWQLLLAYFRQGIPQDKIGLLGQFPFSEIQKKIELFPVTEYTQFSQLKVSCESRGPFPMSLWRATNEY